MNELNKNSHPGDKESCQSDAVAGVEVPNHSLYPLETAEVMKAKAKKSTIKTWAFWITLNIVFILFFSFKKRSGYTPSIAVMFAILLIGCMAFFVFCAKIHIILHELGHAAAGLWGGQRLVLLSFGRWRYERTLAGFRWRRVLPVKGVGGVAIMVPDFEKQFQHSKQGYIIYMLGGVFANFFCAALGFGLLHSFFVSSGSLLKIMVSLFYLSALWLGLVNLIPFKSKGFESDGFQIWKTLRGRGDAITEKILYTSSASLAGVRPKKWPHEKLPSTAELEAKAG